MKKKFLTVAITGGIGSGKSTFAGFLKTEGYKVLNADDISKQILANDDNIKKSVIKSFGAESFTTDGINKKYLSKIAFSDARKLEKLNSILHPAVLKSLDSQIEKLKAEHKIVFVEAALIFEAQMEKQFDIIVVVTSDKKVRKERILKSNKFSAEQFDSRIKMQIDENKKIKKADFVFYNNGSVRELKEKASFLLITLNTMFN